MQQQPPRQHSKAVWPQQQLYNSRRREANRAAMPLIGCGTITTEAATRRGTLLFLFNFFLSALNDRSATHSIQIPFEQFSFSTLFVLSLFTETLFIHLPI